MSGRFRFVRSPFCIIGKALWMWTNLLSNISPSIPYSRCLFQWRRYVAFFCSAQPLHLQKHLTLEMQRLRRAEKTVERHHSNGLWFPQFVSVEYVHCLISYHNFLMSKVRASWSEKEGGSLCKPQHFNTSMNEYFIGRACGTRKYRSRGKCMHHFLRGFCCV